MQAILFVTAVCSAEDCKTILIDECYIFIE